MKKVVLWQIAATVVMVVAALVGYAVSGPEIAAFIAILMAPIVLTVVATLILVFRVFGPKKIPTFTVAGTYAGGCAINWIIAMGFLHIAANPAMWLLIAFLAAVSIYLLAYQPTLRLYWERIKRRLEMRRTKLRIALEQQPPVSYRIQGVPDVQRETEAELEAVEAELVEIEKRLAV